MRNKRQKVLFCNAFKAPYIDTEKEIFKENFEVIFYEYSISSTIFGKIYNIFKNMYVALLHVPRVDVVYSIFGGFHGFFPILVAKIINKKSIITVCGYDAVNIPSIEFGVFFKKNLLRWCVSKEFQWADYILTVDQSLEKSINYYADPNGFGFPNGIRNFVETKAQIITVPFGYDPIKFKKNKNSLQAKGVITVGWATSDQVFLRKGFDFFLEVAKILPEIPFTIIGVSTELQAKLQHLFPNNVTVYKFLEHEKMISLLSEHKVFLQLSLSEGMPNTLCEAMLCECIPIGSNVNGIPKAIGDTGFVLMERNIGILKRFIYDALGLDENHGFKARQHIIEKFPLQKRINALKAIIEN